MLVGRLGVDTRDPHRMTMIVSHEVNNQHVEVSFKSPTRVLSQKQDRTVPDSATLWIENIIHSTKL